MLKKENVFKVECIKTPTGTWVNGVAPSFKVGKQYTVNFYYCNIGTTIDGEFKIIVHITVLDHSKKNGINFYGLEGLEKFNECFKIRRCI